MLNFSRIGWLPVFALTQLFAVEAHAEGPYHDLVQDEAAASRIAEAILVSLYGEGVLKHRGPLTASLVEGLWRVEAPLAEPGVGEYTVAGGSIIIYLSKKDVQVKNIEFYQ
jgi:hypothetical protein